MQNAHTQVVRAEARTGKRKSPGVDVYFEDKDAAAAAVKVAEEKELLGGYKIAKAKVHVQMLPLNQQAKQRRPGPRTT